MACIYCNDDPKVQPNCYCAPITIVMPSQKMGKSLTREMHNYALANMDKPNLNQMYGSLSGKGKLDVDRRRFKRMVRKLFGARRNSIPR